MRGILLLWLLPFLSGAQTPVDTAARFSFESSLYASRIITGEANLQAFTSLHPLTIQAGLSWVRNGRSQWNYCNCLIRNGSSLTWTDFKDGRLGHAFSVSAYTEPVLWHRPRWQVSLQGGTGLAYMTRVYNANSNPENTFYSAPLSFLLTLGPSVQWQLNPHWFLSLHGRLQHISNGGRRDPNDGMNLLSAGLQLRYTPSLSVYHLWEHKKRPPNQWVTTVHAFGFYRQLTPSSPSVPVGGFNATFARTLGRISALGLGGELYYDGLSKYRKQQSGEAIADWVPSMHIAHQLTLGKLLFSQQLAWYLTLQTGFSERTFQRYVLAYSFKPGWYGGITLKAHVDRSDYFALLVARRW